MIAQHAREVNTARILITEHIAQEGIDLLRYELPDADIDVRIRSLSRTSAEGDR